MDDAVVGEVLVDLVGHDHQVVLAQARPATNANSLAVNTLPVGLWGVLRMINIVLWLTSGANSSGRSRTRRRAGPGEPGGDGTGERDARLVAVVHRLEEHDLVTGVEQTEEGAGEASVQPVVTNTSPSGSYSNPQNATLVTGDRLAQDGHAGAGRVLVEAARMHSTAASSTSWGPS